MGMRYTKKSMGMTAGEPGPGSYDIEKSDHIKTLGGVGSSPSKAKFSFPKQSRNTNDMDMKKADMPDPATYSPKQMKAKVGITLGMKLSSELGSQKMISPGPG